MSSRQIRPITVASVSYTHLEKITLEERLVRTANKDFVTTEVEPMWDAADLMRMGKDIFIQHGLTTNRTAMEWFQRYYPEYRIHAMNFPGDPYPIHIDATFVPLRPGLIINNPQMCIRDRSYIDPTIPRAAFKIESVYELPEHFIMWEYAIAMCGYLMKVLSLIHI